MDYQIRQRRPRHTTADPVDIRSTSSATAHEREIRMHCECVAHDRANGLLDRPLGDFEWQPPAARPILHRKRM